ncbi:sce7725 family protein [Pyramidobacter piscolens]|uniref:sce7725 family protein n=2 Tax=Pyramidobacter piscolens TaxID=638849 RepID=UPI00058BCEB5|nr:sce7725 family protein [Pyramidobacter piscolens]
MYFPYVRGRQYELLALRELATNNLLGDSVTPIVEPVKLSPTLVNVMAEFIKIGHPISIIRNPAVGTFMSDWQDVQEQSKEAAYKQRFSEQYKDSTIIKSLIMQENAKVLLELWDEQNVNKSDLLVINTDRDYLELYESTFETEVPRYVLMPDESVFRRKVRHHKVLLDDKFERQGRNADYQESEDEFFSDDHLFYKEDGFIGFSDYSVVGNEYLEAGFAPYAVAIHIVYFTSDKTLRVRHFVSDSNEDITNPALKFYEAVSKLAAWYNAGPHPVEMTSGLRTFLQHHEQQSYPGLGTVKKLSLMHHLELMGKFLARGNAYVLLQ